MLTLLDSRNPHQAFPPVDLALTDPDGLLAVGGDLSPPRILNAYRRGIFPWYNPGEPILWWSPNPRLVLFPEKLKVSRSLRKTIRKKEFQVSFDRDFRQVIHACAAPRKGAMGTWITPEMRSAYVRLHQLGHAHSVECWYRGELAGGLYGVTIGRVFYGESMFHRFSNASKVAFVILVEALKSWRYALIDCQVYTPHMVTLGAEEIPRQEFVRLLKHRCEEGSAAGAWQPL